MKAYQRLLNIFFLSSALLIATSLAYDNAGECTDESILATEITDSDTLGEWYLGWDIDVPTATYCTHDAYYSFNITYTLGTDDTDSLFIANIVDMVYDETLKSCYYKSTGTQETLATNT